LSLSFIEASFLYGLMSSMKKLSDAMALALAISFGSTLSVMPSESPVQAITLHEANIPSIIHSVPYPKSIKSKNATYHIGLQVAGMPLSQLVINVPKRIRVTNKIEVMDQAKRKISTDITINDGKVIITFAQPVPADTTLEIDMKGIDASSYLPSTRLFTISGTVLGLRGEIPFGTARFQTRRG
jgi:Protein of unknown function (DUF2808)